MDKDSILLMTKLYKELYMQTLWNTTDLKKKREGWELKGNKVWAPWFFNMRPVGSSPRLFHHCNSRMKDLINADTDRPDMLIAVEMAGINSSGGTAICSFLEDGIEMPIGYTRPLPKKVRTPMEALALLRNMEAGEEESDSEKLVSAIGTAIGELEYINSKLQL